LIPGSELEMVCLTDPVAGWPSIPSVQH